eukprot:m51a1_g6349 hypothetical protein (242) ;mRNA; r:79196-80218
MSGASTSVADKSAEIKALDAIFQQLPPQDPRRKRVDCARKLLHKYEQFTTRAAFKPGDLVKWKAGLVNRRLPAPDSVAIVSRVYDQPIYDPHKKDAGNAYWREPLDIAIAIVDTEDEFVEFHFDSRRFQLVDEVDCAPRVVSRLRENLRLLHGPRHKFEVGDAVRWKPGMQNKRRPRIDEPAAVAEVLPEPVFDESKDAGGQYFREPLDIKIAILDDDGEFIVYHFDSRRFEPAPPISDTR